MSVEKANADSCGLLGSVAFTTGLLVGTATTVTTKVMYESSSVDSTGNERTFDKPLFMTFMMFLSMITSLLVYPCVVPIEERSKLSWRTVILLIIPSAFDLLGTTLAGIGLLYVTVSLYQLARCMVIIITALLKAFILYERLATHMWLGIFINLAAMAIVSASALVPTETKGQKDASLGLFFIFLSCLVQGAQYVFEEKVMSIAGAHPLVLVGLEGLWGTVFMCVCVFPAAYYLPGSDNGSVESVYDSYVMVVNSQTLQVLLVVFFVTVAMYNICALYVTKLLSSIWHAILDNFRPIAVWGADLLIFYVFTEGSFGEQWCYPWSYVQLGGMVALFFGTAVYNGSIPCLDWTDYDEIEDFSAGAQIIHTRGSMSSPALMRSPMIMRNFSSNTSHVTISKPSYKIQIQEDPDPERESLGLIAPKKTSIANTKFNIRDLPR